MFNEYQLLPGQTFLLVRQGLLTMFTYWLCAALLLAWMYYGEPVAFQLALHRSVLAPIVIALTGVFVGAGVIASAKAFRMYSSDEGLHMSRYDQAAQLRYADITRIEILPKGHLLVYTHASATTPSLLISNSITNRDKLDAILQHYRPYEPATRLPLVYNLFYRLTASAFFILTLGLHLITFNGNVRIVAGLLFIAHCSYKLYIAWKHRAVTKNYTSQILLALLCVVVLFRCITSLLPLFLQQY